MRIFLTIALCSVAVLTLTGCQTAKPVSMSVGVTPTLSGTVGNDVLAAYRAAGQDIPPLQGQEVVTVRTYEYSLKTDAVGASKTEIEGVNCLLESDGYRAEIRTPAEVTVPDYGYATRPIRVSCNSAGFKTSAATIQTYSKTSAARMDTAHQGGLAGVVFVAMIDAASDKTKHDYGYRPAQITMNRIGCETSKVACR